MLLFEIKWDGKSRGFGPLHYMIYRCQSIPSFLMTMSDDLIATAYPTALAVHVSPGIPFSK